MTGVSHIDGLSLRRKAPLKKSELPYVYLFEAYVEHC